MADLHKMRLDNIAENVHGLKDIERMSSLSDKDKSYIHSKVKENAAKTYRKENDKKLRGK